MKAVDIWPLLLGISWLRSTAGFLAATSPPPPPPTPAFGGFKRVRTSTASCPATVSAVAAASAPATTGSPATVSASVLSPREAVLELPPLDDNVAGEGSYSIRWFEEENPAVFDQAMASLQSRLVLSGLSPSTNYVALLRRTGGTQPGEGAGAAGEVRFSTPEAEGNASGELTELSRLEIRVGRCLEVSKHPDADSLYIEKVDFGEGEPRTIVSGLVAYVPEEAMRGRMVLGLCNLPARAMRGVASAGMLLCASNDDHTIVDPLSPPEGAKVGELVTFDGVLSAPAPPSSAASRAWSATMEGMKTGDAGVAGWDGRPMQTSAGPCTSTVVTGRVR
eukprot:g7844.t1